MVRFPWSLPLPKLGKGFAWNTGYQNLIHFHRAGPRWGVDQDFFGELQKRGPACEAAQPDLCLCDSLYISRLIVVKFWMIARPAVAVLDIYIYVQLVASITMTRRRVLQ